MCRIQRSQIGPPDFPFERVIVVLVVVPERDLALDSEGLSMAKNPEMPLELVVDAGAGEVQIEPGQAIAAPPVRFSRAPLLVH